MVGTLRNHFAAHMAFALYSISRPMSSILRTPKIAMSRSISRVRSLIARATPNLPAGRGEKEGPANEDRVRTKRQRLDHIGSATETTIDHDGKTAGLSLYVRQYLQRTTTNGSTGSSHPRRSRAPRPPVREFP
jgi:hypothetical protein